MSPEEEILALVRELVAQQGGNPDAIVPQAQLADLGIDSLRAIDLIFRFEEAFGITVPMEDFPQTTVADAVAFVIKLRKAKPQTSAAD